MTKLKRILKSLGNNFQSTTVLDHNIFNFCCRRFLQIQIFIGFRTILSKLLMLKFTFPEPLSLDNDKQNNTITTKTITTYASKFQSSNFRKSTKQ